MPEQLKANELGKIIVKRIVENATFLPDDHVSERKPPVGKLQKL